jgi:hypothetical protein
MAVLLLSCSRMHPSRPADHALTPSPVPTWPNYSALDYDKPGHPPITGAEIALIHKTLSLLRPCQAVQLRYAFPKNRKNAVALFFDNPGEPNVLWNVNAVYSRAEGFEDAVPFDSQPFPKDAGTAREVQSQGCAKP